MLALNVFSPHETFKYQGSKGLKYMARWPPSFTDFGKIKIKSWILPLAFSFQGIQDKRRSWEGIACIWLPVQVRRMILDAWGWCTEMTQRDGTGREEGGVFRMANTCIPVVDTFWYLAKLIQLCKVKNKIKKFKKN